MERPYSEVETAMSETTQFRVMDFDCPTCASNVERALKQTNGIERVEVHFTTGRVEVEFNPHVASPEEIQSVIMKQGYTPQLA